MFLEILLEQKVSHVLEKITNNILIKNLKKIAKASFLYKLNNKK